MATYYTIGAGDTLGNIAAYYGVSTATLAAMNGIRNPNVIKAGQTIVVPDQGAAQVDPADTTGLDTPSPSPTSVPLAPVGTDANPLQLSPMTITGTPSIDWQKLLQPPGIFYVAAALAAAAYLYHQKGKRT